MADAPKYIVEQGGGNPRVLQRTEEGTYKALTHGAGESTIPDLIEMARLANDSLGLNS